MDDRMQKDSSARLQGLPELLPTLESIYKDIHAHPELSMQETRPAGIATGGIDSDMYEQARKTGRIAEIPTNHSPRFAPVIHPTLRQAWRRWWWPLSPGYRDDHGH
jgi:metal-dependent amidase/aminoacylase/carboxypeptidase family protein